MNREQTLATLRDYAPELKSIGVLSVSVFGSVARAEARADSDVDLVVRLSDDFSQGGLAYFEQMDDLGKRLSAVLGRKVDIIEEPLRKERLRIEIDRDRVFAF